MNCFNLTNPGSLTRYLTNRFGDHVSHQLITESWTNPLLCEQHKLPIDKGWVREIQWVKEAETLIYARTLIPAATLAHCFNNKPIGHRSLGQIIFDTTQLHYSAFTITEIDNTHALYQATQKHITNLPSTLTSRQRVFYYQDHPLLVTEIFLPAFFHHVTRSCKK